MSLDLDQMELDLMVTVPRPARVSRSVIGPAAVLPVVLIAPAVKLAVRTDRSVNAARFTAVKSAGGSEVSCRMAAQSCLDQAAR